MQILANLLSLAFIVLVLSLDAARLRKEHPAIYQLRMGSKPAIWGILTFFFTVLVLPVYLFSRNRYFSDYHRLPPGQTEVAGKNSFLKTCLSAKIIITWFFIVQAVSIIVVLVAHGMGISMDFLNQTMDFNLLGTFFFLCVFFVFSGLAAREYPHLGFKEIFDLRYKNLNKFKVFFVPLLISFFMAVLTVYLMKIRKVTPPTPLGTSLAQSSSWVKLAFVIFGAFLAPVFEELIYRGAFFRVLLKNKDKIWAIVGTSLCFWAVHADRAGDHLVLVILLCFSLCVTIIRFLTRTTLTAIIMHYTHNISVFVLSFLLLVFTNMSLFKSHYLDFFPKDRHESILLEALEKNPDLSEVYNNLAWFYATENQNLGKALSLVGQSIRLDPGSSAAYDTKALILFKLGKVDEAIAIEEDLVRRFPAVSFFKEQLQTFQKKRS